MSKPIKEIRATVEVSLMFGDFSIEISNTHNNKLMYKVSEKSTSKGWERVAHNASEYILDDFKKTKEHQEIVAVIKEATKNYGF